jgi:hypothetical protein
MTESNRDLKKPISCCCEQLEYELSRGDFIEYRWHTREFILRSSKTPIIFTYADFCPFCGKDLEKFSLHDEYWEAFEKAAEEDPTMRTQSASELEGFDEKFLRDWESRNPIQ